MAERIACLQSECGLSTSVEEFKEQYHFGLVEAVFEWARGMPFSEITNLTDVQEGKIRLLGSVNNKREETKKAWVFKGRPTLIEDNN